MPFAMTIPGAIGRRIAIAETPEILSAVHHPDCAAAIWHRKPLAQFQSWLDGLSANQLPKARLILRPDRVCDALLDIAQICGTPDCAERNMLVEDAAALAAIFAQVVGVEYLRLRFDTVAAEACHALYAPPSMARLICTYRGTGMQYDPARGRVATNTLSTVGTGSPVLLRGDAHVGKPMPDLFRHSAPIAGDNRFVLVLDPVAEETTDPDRPYLH